MNTFIWSLLDDHKVKFEKKKKQNQKNKQTKNTNFYEEREHTMTNSSFFFFGTWKMSQRIQLQQTPL